MRDKLDAQSGDINGVRSLKAEIESERDKTKKYRLDCDIKENQIRSLKSRLEQYTEEVKNFSSA